MKNEDEIKFNSRKLDFEFTMIKKYRRMEETNDIFFL